MTEASRESDIAGFATRFAALERRVDLWEATQEAEGKRPMPAPIMDQVPSEDLRMSTLITKPNDGRHIAIHNDGASRNAIAWKTYDIRIRAELGRRELLGEAQSNNRAILENAYCWKDFTGRKIVFGQVELGDDVKVTFANKSFSMNGKVTKLDPKDCRILFSGSTEIREGELHQIVDREKYRFESGKSRLVDSHGTIRYDVLPSLTGTKLAIHGHYEGLFPGPSTLRYEAEDFKGTTVQRNVALWVEEYLSTERGVEIIGRLPKDGKK